MTKNIILTLLLSSLALSAPAAPLKPEIAHLHPDELAIADAPLLITGEHFEPKSQVVTWRPPGEEAVIIAAMLKLGEPVPERGQFLILVTLVDSCRSPSPQLPQSRCLMDK